MKFHPIANLFPMLPDNELEALAEDIRQHGQRDPVLIFQSKILDGRNRWTACEKVGIKAITKEWSGTKSEAIRYVWSTNFHRRHLTSSQTAMALAERKKIDPSFVKEVIGPIQEEAKQEQKKSKGRGKKGVKKLPHLKTRDKIAKLHGTNANFVATCERILEEHPEYAEAIKSGAKSITQVTREIKKLEITKVVDWPDGKYRVIYADPPWSYGNTQPDYQTEQRDHYPVMPLKDICALPVKDLSLDNSVLFLWVTSPILEESFQVIKSWGFKYKASFVWDKVGHNMGHYNSVRHEFLLICVRGSCQPDASKLYDSVQSIERIQHSGKPEFFREIIDTLYPHGPRIELFARTAAEGWERYGNQA